ncbi:MAG: HEAT repeat domain-containing protein [Fimbriimonadales bacterium]|nr:MAG: hypothetical protein KatS3mg018_1951 [Fimbriimonadales bacterium]
MTQLQITLEIPCANGVQPVQVGVAYWGEVLAPSNPFAELVGEAFARMVPDECYQKYQHLATRLEQNAPLMLERTLLQQNAQHEDAQVRRFWGEFLNALDAMESAARQTLADPDAPEQARVWATAVAGAPTAIADLIDAIPVSRWAWGNQLWLLRRALRNDTSVWKFLWDALPRLRDSLQEPASLVALAMGLGQSKSDYAWDVLEPVLAHPDASVRTAATQAVAQLKESRARDLLRARLHAEPETPVIHAIVEALGAVGEAQDARTLIDYAFEHPHARNPVRNALTQMGTLALPAIDQTLQDTFDDTLKELLIQTLQQIDRPEVVPPLKRMVNPHQKPRVRLQAVRALRALRYNESLPPLTLALGDEDYSIQREAQQALVERGMDAAPVLLDAIQQPAQWEPRMRFSAQWRAGQALAAICSGDESIKQELMALAESYDLNQRWVALTALRYADYPDIGDWMANQLYGSPDTIQLECAMYLRKYPTPTAIPALMDAVRDCDSAVRAALEDAVAASGVAAIPVIQRHFAEWQTFAQRQSLTRILRQIGHPAACSLLEQLANDSDERIAGAAQEAYQHICSGDDR